MGLQATFVMYLVIGVGVESALLCGRDQPPVSRWFSILTGILFWPLYVPILLSPHADDAPPTIAPQQSILPRTGGRASTRAIDRSRITADGPSGRIDPSL